MRLLNTERCMLYEANDIPLPFPQYAILSHTWITPKDEITYQDLRTRKGDIENGVYKQKGWKKLKRYCDRAKKDGWKWAWMDTCCIDKTSPADTQEAINAMFRWYQNAGICYAYLEDLDLSSILSYEEHGRSGDSDDDEDLDDITITHNDTDPRSFPRDEIAIVFVGAKWFTRGWTLQELLAPHYLVFVDKAWRKIGTRENWAAEIEKASNIGVRHLTAFSPTNFTSCSIAMRLSWASQRETTVEEDETYSLLGLFGVSLPLIYGEGGRRAFTRLQRELIMVYNDDSIFAWKAEVEPVQGSLYPQWTDLDSGREGSILATSTKQFKDASDIEACGHHGNSFSMTNRGLEINAKLWRHSMKPYNCVIQLNCNIKDQPIGIYLKLSHGAYERSRVDELCDMKSVDRSAWAKEPSTSATLIRVYHQSSPPKYFSIFGLKYPQHICIGKMYFIDFGFATARANMQLLDQDSQPGGLKENELILPPNRLTFINIQVPNGGGNIELDVIINLTESNHPCIGVLRRDAVGRERLGEPLVDALDSYQNLADYLHYKFPTSPTYPTIASVGGDLTVGVQLLPRPQQSREGKLFQVGDKYRAHREYVVRIYVSSAGQPLCSMKRKRTS